MSNTITMKDVLDCLDLGSAVAEHDGALEKYFVETEPFKVLTEGRVDIIAGDKGTGKSAIFQILCARYHGIKALKEVEVLPGFNITGNPIFQRLAQEDVLTEAQYVSLWKAYVLSLTGNWLLEIFGTETENLKSLDRLLQSASLKSGDSAPQTIFSKLMNSIRKVRSTEVAFSFTENGIPIVVPKIEFGTATNENDTPIVLHEDALRLLNTCLNECSVTVWVALDRLDEAFQGFPNIEIPALRALLRTYLDLLEFDRMRLKLFVRKDLFRKVTNGGFVNLTHINARKIEIVWDEDDLLNLLCQRIRESSKFINLVGLKDASNKEIFTSIFPDQIDSGERKPTAWNWIMSRVRDGNGVTPPRNLIDLVVKARQAQLRQEARTPRFFNSELAIIESDATKLGLAGLSTDRTEDTLLAESGEASKYIEKFRGKKSEYDVASLNTLLGEAEENSMQVIRQLTDIGFLEKSGENYKIPMLYRDGLEIVQGKAYQT